MMNAYLFTVPFDLVKRVYICVEGNVGYNEFYRPFNLVFAPTRGKAKAIFCMEYDLEWTYPMLTRTIAKDVNRDEGIANWDDVIWLQSNWTLSDDGKQLVYFPWPNDTQEFEFDYTDYPAGSV